MPLLPYIVLSYSYLFCITMIMLNLPIQTAGAANYEVQEQISNPTAEKSGGAAQELTSEPTAVHTFNFEDVFEIDLHLDISADIEFIATEGGVIKVIFEGQAPAIPTEPDATLQTYLDNISVTGTRSDSTLHLKIQHPEGAGSPAALNRSSSVEDLPMTLHEQLRLKCIIKSPSDISVRIESKMGNVRLHGIRGQIEIATTSGDVYLNETSGNYNVTLTNGDIKGKILLTRGQNTLETKHGTIDLTVLDPVAAPMDITAQDGNIILRLPEGYAIDAVLESKKQQVVVNLPVQFEDDTTLAIVNDGGPLFRLKSTDSISLLQNMLINDQASAQADTEQSLFLESAQRVPETSSPPIIDGNLSEIVWQAASPLPPLQNTDGTEAPNNLTETFLMWDAQNFYIGVKAHISNAQLPHISQTQHDSPIWEDECIEILIDTNPQTYGYYHLVVNPIRALFDQQVSKPGKACYPFAPRDVQLALNKETLQTDFEANKAWNSNAKVGTQINATFWSLEVAIPLEILEKPPQMNLKTSRSSKNITLFNIHRKIHLTVKSTEHLVSNIQREYSYWLPTYDNEHPWWPHSPHVYAAPLSEYIAPAMGALHFVKRSPSFSQTFATEVQFRVKAVDVEGNAVIPTAVVQQQIPLRSGDIITSTQLSWLLAELRDRDWFQEVRLETKQGTIDAIDNEESGTLTAIGVLIQVTEAPVIFARHVKIKGNRTFPSTFIKRWFQLDSGYLAVDTVRLKQQLIADFYVNRGYEFATVTYEFANDVLTFSINEGTLHEVRFVGNTRISRTELLSALNIKTTNADGKRGSQGPDIYHATLGQSKIDLMQKRLRAENEHFKSIQSWQVQRDGRKNILVVEIEEQPLTKTSVFPILQFNRVHGLMLGAGGTIATQFTGKEQILGSVSRGFSSKIWNYYGGIEKVFFQRRHLRLGASVYKITNISSNASLRPGNITLSAAYYGFALQDYYQRQGIQGWITYEPSEWNYLRLALTTEAHDNLSKSTDWSYLNRNQIKRGNARIDRGQLEGLSLIYAFDTRDHTSTTRQHFHTLSSANERTQHGWRGRFGMEIAGGDYAFNLYQFELIRYTPFFRPHHLHVRVAGDLSNAPLPTQQLLHLGGNATLRGYGFNRFAGDNRLLLNLEYRFIKEILPQESGAALGWTLSCFLDAGRVWWHGDSLFSDSAPLTAQFRTSVGVGCSVFIDPPEDLAPVSIALEIAEPLDASFSLQNPSIVLRLDRIF